MEAFVPLHPVAERILSLYNTTDDTNPVFPLPIRDILWHEVHSIGNALEFEENLSPRQARHTFLHSEEEVLNVPNRLTDKPLQLTVVDEAGAEHTVYMRRHYNAQQPHISEDFVKLEQAYLDCGAAKITKFGDAACILCDANELFRVTRHVLAPDPEAVVTEPVIPAQRWKELCTETR